MRTALEKYYKNVKIDQTKSVIAGVVQRLERGTHKP